MSARLLILSCSDTKRELPADRSTLPALELYDGPAYKVVRGYLDRVPMMGASNLRILILSAEHGLIGGWDSLKPYDRKMDAERAATIAKSSAAVRTMEGSLACMPEVFVFGGPAYRNCVSRLIVRAKARAESGMAELRVTFAEGRGIGDHLSQLKAWLEAGTLTEEQRADAIALELDALERRYDGPMPSDAVARIDALNAELRRIIRNRPASV